MLALVCGATLAFLPALAKAEESDGKPLLVFIFDNSCRISCSRVRPAMDEIKREYGNEVDLIMVDVSPENHSQAMDLARKYGVADFVENSEKWYPVVGVFSSNRKCVKELFGARTTAEYKAVLEKLRAKDKKKKQ
jgi:thiol-disulfide isomerase/thioredoxin